MSTILVIFIISLLLLTSFAFIYILVQKKCEKNRFIKFGLVINIILLLVVIFNSEMFFKYINSEKISDANVNISQNLIETNIKKTNDIENITNDNQETTPKVNNDQQSNKVDYQWYMSRTLFTSENEKHNFIMDWLDDGKLEFNFDDGLMVGGTDEIDNKTITNGLLYEDLQASGKIQIIYYYNENYIQVIDELEQGVNYTGFYYPQTKDE